MKLYLNKKQRNYLLEVFKVSENNAIDGRDAELANAFNDLYEKIKPLNTAYINLDRGESETIVEFCDIIRSSLDKALTFLNNDKTRDETQKEELKKEVMSARTEVDEITNQLQKKIKENPV